MRGGPLVRRGVAGSPAEQEARGERGAAEAGGDRARRAVEARIGAIRDGVRKLDVALAQQWPNGIRDEARALAEQVALVDVALKDAPWLRTEYTTVLVEAEQKLVDAAERLKALEGLGRE